MLEQLPLQALMASGFLTYLSHAPEDERRNKLEKWKEATGVKEFDLKHFLSTESELLAWKAEGLPFDDLSLENAAVILQVLVCTFRIQMFSGADHVTLIQCCRCPFLIDPSQRATEWLKTHLRESRLEVINQQVRVRVPSCMITLQMILFFLQDSNFTTALELAVRFGKTLVIQEVDIIEPILYPLLRGDLISQGDIQQHTCSELL